MKIQTIVSLAGAAFAVTACETSRETTQLGGAGLGLLDRCAVITASVEDAGFGDTVSVTCDADYAYLLSSADPGHDMMNGLSVTNERVPVPAVGYTIAIPLHPERARMVSMQASALAVAVNGVAIHDYSSASLPSSDYDPASDLKLQGELDRCNGRAGLADDYHYSAAPVCLMNRMENAGPGAILGWAFDGYPIYGAQNPDGSAIPAGTLDACNGQYDLTFGYRYHTTDAAPYVPRCLVGVRGPGHRSEILPLEAAAGVTTTAAEPSEARPVTNLVFAEDLVGGRSMSYVFEGAKYFIRYVPTAVEGCWDFEERTVSTGGALVRATYCRRYSLTRGV